MYLQLLTFAVIAVVVIFIYFQIIKPLLRGTPLFPFISEREKVEGQIEKEEESLDVRKEKNRLDKLTKRSENGRKVED